MFVRVAHDDHVSRRIQAFKVGRDAKTTGSKLETTGYWDAKYDDGTGTGFELGESAGRAG